MKCSARDQAVSHQLTNHGNPGSIPGHVMWDLWCINWQRAGFIRGLWFSVPILIQQTAP
jgi:hypothetical protein